MVAPKLRFKEFDANWSLSSLGKMTTYFKGYAFKSESYKDSGIRVIRVSDLGRESIKTDNDSIYIEANNASAYENWIIKKDDIIITTVGSKPHLVDSAVGRPIYVKNNNEGLLNQNLLVLRPIDETVDSYFIYAQLLDKKYLTHIELIQRGNANQSNITVKDLQDFETYITSKKEQTKIASFLSAVDEKISQLNQKHELLSQYKQGMMQKLFSQQIRFKADDGSEFGEWEEKTLIDSVDTNIKWSFTGGPFGSNLKSEDYTELGIRIIQLQNIGDGAFLNDYKIYTSPEKANELLSCNIYPDEILISKMGDPVARCCIVPKHHDRYVMCSDGIRLVVDKKNYSSIFMFYQINYQDFRQTASDVSTGSTRKRIGLSDLKQLPIKAPCLEEQTKIANFLSAIDQKIEVVAQQIEQAKSWKKGLLQQMFV